MVNRSAFKVGVNPGELWHSVLTPSGTVFTFDPEEDSDPDYVWALRAWVDYVEGTRVGLTEDEVIWDD